MPAEKLFVFFSISITFLVFANACWTLSWMSGGNADFIEDYCHFFCFKWLSCTVLLSEAPSNRLRLAFLNIFLLVSMILLKSFFPADSWTLLFLLLFDGDLWVRVSHDFLSFNNVCLNFRFVLMLGHSKSSPISIWYVSTD